MNTLPCCLHRNKNVFLWQSQLKLTKLQVNSTDLTHRGINAFVKKVPWGLCWTLIEYKNCSSSPIKPGKSKLHKPLLAQHPYGCIITTGYRIKTLRPFMTVKVVQWCIIPKNISYYNTVNWNTAQIILTFLNYRAFRAGTLATSCSHSSLHSSHMNGDTFK